MVDENICECFCYDEEKVNRIKREVESIVEMARLFKALSDETRLKVVYSLSREELCVCDVAQITGTSVAVASHHLRLLKNMGLARSRKQGKMVFYTLRDSCIKTIIETALEHQNNHYDNTTSKSNGGY